jgi:hypothetical protein
MSLSSPYYLGSQSNSAVITHAFDFTEYMLVIGSTISNATVTECTDTIVISNVFATNTVVTFNSTGGDPGSNYTIVCDIATASGNLIPTPAILNIVESCE